MSVSRVLPLLLATLAVACASSPRVNGSEPGFQRVAVDAESGAPAAVTVSVLEVGAVDPRGPSRAGLVLALWRDGTVVWSVADDGCGAPLRRTRISHQRAQREIDQIARTIEALQPGDRQVTSPDGYELGVLARGEDEWLALATDAFPALTRAFVATDRDGAVRAEADAWAARTPATPAGFVSAWRNLREHLAALVDPPGEPLDASQVRLQPLRR